MDDSIEISVPIEPDEEGMIGRECPVKECEKYFKLKNGTGIEVNPVMFCPYCSYKGTPDEFWTKEQIEYAESMAMRHVEGMIHKELKKMERHSFKSDFLSMDIKVKRTPVLLKHYMEKQLQEYIVCENCGCEYAIYGVFAICLDCGKHNLFQIFSKNLDLISKQIQLEEDLYNKFGETNRNDIDNLMRDLKSKFIEDACENAVTTFETFCKEAINQAKTKASNPNMVLRGNPFQSLDRTKDIFTSQFNLDIFENLSPDETDELYLLFNKRHILTHNLGIIDQKFLKDTGLRQNILNHKVEISKQEVSSGLSTLRKIAENIKTRLIV